jgi:hypothetical protein
VKYVIGWTGVVAVALASLVAVYGLYLMALGPILTVVTPGGAATAVHEPNPGGVVPFVGATLIWYGVQRGKQRWTWIGAIVVLVFSVLGVFGPGGILIPPAIALMVVLFARRILGQEGRTAGRSEP